MNEGFKVFTHDYRSPIRGGAPVFDGRTPFTLPTVDLDIGEAECAAGWNYAADLSTALRTAGLWPNGFTSTAFVVEASGGIQRGDKCRAATLTIVRACTAKEIEAAIEKLSEPLGEHRSSMAREQILWRAALARPYRDEAKVREGLEMAIQCRGLGWKLERFDSAGAARDAWAARAARAAWDAWAALIVFFAALQKWIDHDPLLLTTGLRDAYLNGLEVAIPVEKDTLGFYCLT